VRLSGFNIYVEDYPAAGETLVHNTFSGAYVVLDSEIVSVLRRADRRAALTPEEQIVAADPDFFDPDVGICVTSRKAEEREFHAWFEERRSDSDVLSVLIGINLACNFDCPYCCQAEVMDGSTMSLETCDATAAWIAGRATEVGVEKISLIFVGGEPLLHPGRIERVLAGVREACDLPLAFSLITNGYFLDEAMLDRLIPLGLRAAQITLDGDETTHHLTRVSKKGENTFQRIFDQVVAASRRIRVSINGNYQPDTVHGFAPLITRLSEAGLAEGSRVKFGPALDALSSESGAGSGSCTFSNSDTRFQLALHDRAEAAGYGAGEVHALGPCSFHDRHSYSIDVDGTLLACPGFLGRRDWGIGHVTGGLTARYQQLLNINAQRECTGCEHRPNCGGGCVAAQWLELGRPEGVNCEKEFFDSVIEPGVVREYAKATGADPPALIPLPETPGIRPAGLRVVV
jgi:uncharacterized protein